MSTCSSPDIGYGYVIVCASFIIQAITSGVRNAFGVILVATIEHFKAGEGKTVWIGSIQYFFMKFSGGQNTSLALSEDFYFFSLCLSLLSVVHNVMKVW